MFAHRQNGIIILSTLLSLLLVASLALFVAEANINVKQQLQHNNAVFKEKTNIKKENCTTLGIHAALNVLMCRSELVFIVQS